MSIYREIAAEYIAAGISVIPLRLDGTKHPAFVWKQYQSRLATRVELSRWFPGHAIGIVGGAISGGLEILDFDNEPDETFFAWRDQLSLEVRGKLTVVETGGLGYHVLYRADDVCGNTKLALSEAGKTIVETRGEGGMVVAVGSPLEVHSTGKPYVQTHGQPLPDLPVVSQAERLEIWQTARSFNRQAVDEIFVNKVRQITRKNRGGLVLPARGGPVGDFNRNADWSEILAGWCHHPGTNCWGRPGKPADKSARVQTADSGDEVLVVFSRSDPDLSPVSGKRYRTWGKFAAFVKIHFNDDWSRALDLIKTRGYGT